MERSLTAGADGDAVVIPLDGRRDGAALVPQQRRPEGFRAGGAAHADADPLGAMPYDLAVTVMSLDRPEEFFRGLGNGLVISMLLIALVVGVLAAAGVLG